MTNAKKIRSIAERGVQTIDDHYAGNDIVNKAIETGWDGKGYKRTVTPQNTYHADTVQAAAQFLRTPKISKKK